MVILCLFSFVDKILNKIRQLALFIWFIRREWYYLISIDLSIYNFVLFASQHCSIFPLRPNANFPTRILLLHKQYYFVLYTSLYLKFSISLLKIFEFLWLYWYLKMCQQVFYMMETISPSYSYFVNLFYSIFWISVLFWLTFLDALLILNFSSVLTGTWC